ncbi:hypothetical protein B0H17DRAFT_428456 [Mycena rosella]|uniref:Secreted protein n=1 Tax=Mycena rosella TaxID=1033263 RepID=A0AAD7G1E9_MYCRO|nr:hypothetical protein B0H17DRAFT_428456 [Mycena rosella]
MALLWLLHWNTEALTGVLVSPADIWSASCPQLLLSHANSDADPIARESCQLAYQRCLWMPRIDRATFQRKVRYLHEKLFL